MVVIGAGPIGMEFAYVFHAYGAEVTVVEALPRILPLEDEEISAEMEKAFKRAGIKTLAGAKVEGAKVSPDGVSLNVADSGGNAQALKADWVLVSIGVMPNSGAIGLDKAGITTDARGFVVVDDRQRTNLPNVYAIGDVTGKLLLAHVASAQGIGAAEHIAGHETVVIMCAILLF